MKKLLLSVLLINIVLISFSQDLFLLNLSDHKISELSKNPKIAAHYVNSEIAIASSDFDINNSILIARNCFMDDSEFFILYKNKTGDNSILYQNKQIDLLLETPNFFIIKTKKSNIKNLPILKADGVVNISKTPIKEPEYTKELPSNITYEQYIATYLTNVNQDSIKNRILKLENYGTRDCFTLESVQAQNWIKSRFELYDLNVEIMDFPIGDSESSDNVIATLTGSTFPEEYVIIGGHYDSYSNDELAPGADDNASGTSGVMEVARILSKGSFKRSIVFCTFSGEEYGLYGSRAYAERCKNEGKNIIAYINLDMIGYLEPGNELHTALIFPETARPLANFYKEVCSVYLPNFSVYEGQLNGGDSDHTSFNNNGFYGLFPFEDDQDYSPHIHSADDIFGLSVNNMELAENFTKAAMANVLVLADNKSQINSTNELMSDKNIHLYPNPNKGEFKVSIPDNKEYSIELFDLSGKLVYKKLCTTENNIRIENIEQGLYIARISLNETLISKIIIIN